MIDWLRGLDVVERRSLQALAAVIVVVAGVMTGLAVAGGDDVPRHALVRTDESTTSTRAPSSTSTSTSTSSPASTSSPTSTRAPGPTTTAAPRRATPAGSAGTQVPVPNDPPVTQRPVTQPPATAPPSSGGPCATGGGQAGQMAGLFCSHRASRGLPAMSRSAALDAMAHEWAQRMANDRALSHRPNAGSMVLARCDCTGWSENVAYDMTVDGAWATWLASGAHRANIENPADGEYGMGAVVSGGYVWVVQVFGYY